MTEATFPGLSDYLATEVARVEQALERSLGRLESRFGGAGRVERGGLERRPSDGTRAGPARRRLLDPDVLSAIHHGVLTGGKRLRPVLCVTAYGACGGDRSDAVYDLGAAIEMIHAYSLMHDDLPCMDDAELRRGRPTVHRVYGEESTMLAGWALIPVAAMQALEACMALGCDLDRSRRVVRRLLEAAGAGGMVGGQWLDLLGEGRALGPAELDGLHRRKTGALLAASLVVGATAAGASRATVDALRDYGRAVGLAFQIADDILDATSSAEALGKNPSDAHLDKSTYVALHGLEEARWRARGQVDAALAALSGAKIESPALGALARYVVERGR